MLTGVSSPRGTSCTATRLLGRGAGGAARRHADRVRSEREVPDASTPSDRFGAHRLVVVNVLLGAGANLAFMAAGSELVLIAATVLHSVMWATLGPIGITVAQDLYPNGIGMASSLYFSAIRFSAAIGGIAGGLGVGWFGVPGVFLVPALLCILAAFGLLIQAVLRHHA
jgi:MFS transporter, SET family, sugar efflux transporter